MRQALKDSINNEVLVLNTQNNKISISVGTLVRLRKKAIQIKRYDGIDEISRANRYVHEYIPYNCINKVSTGQKVLTR